MKVSTRRNFFASAAGAATALAGVPRLFAQQSVPVKKHHQTASNHVHNGIFYFYGTGANDGYPPSDHVGVTDPFDKHVSRTMDALKKSLEDQGCTMDSILHLQVFTCLPLSDSTPMPTGKARFDAHKAQYDALNKIYKTYFSPGKAPSRACMAVEWIPGDSLIEIVGSALVVSESPSAS